MRRFILIAIISLAPVHMALADWSVYFGGGGVYTNLESNSDYPEIPARTVKYGDGRKLQGQCDGLAGVRRVHVHRSLRACGEVLRFRQGQG